LIWAFRAGSLASACFSGIFDPEYWQGEGGRGSVRGQRQGADATWASWMALVSSWTHLSIASSSITTDSPGVCFRSRPGMQRTPLV
jgi:hypothetical protein